ncbi:MAG TPA: SDR family oxidoreductase [Terracidiphilus sp.]|nr:SDR family oxidoreductase [Terracidiphilus sp.]
MPTSTEPGRKTNPTIVVLGGTGMLGHKVFQKFATASPDTFCTIRQSTADESIARIPLFQSDRTIGGIDAIHFEQLSSLLRSIQPDFIINCIGVIKQRPEASSCARVIALNSLLPHQLAALCSEWNGRLIHFSTDCVFSGRHGMYRENDSSDAQDLYGRSKFLGETVADNALTLRTSIIGRELATHRSLLDWFLWNNGGEVQGYRKSIYSGVTTNHLAEIVLDIVLHHPHLSGLYQIAAHPISKCDLLLLLKEAYALDVAICPVDGEESDRSMDGSKLSAAIGYDCPAWKTLVEQLAHDPTPYDEWLGVAQGAVRSRQ